MHRLKTDEIHLIQKCFPQNDYFATFPLAFPVRSDWHKVRIEEKGKLVSFLVLQIIAWQAEGEMIHAAMIGSVCTDPCCRNKGFGQKALSAAIARAKNCNLEGVILFSPTSTFYAKAGFVPVGTEILVAVPASESGNRFLFLSELSPRYPQNLLQICATTKLLKDASASAALWRWQSRHSKAADSILSYTDFCTALAIPNMDLVTLEVEGCLKAMSFFGKGADCHNTLHGIVACDPFFESQLIALFIQMHHQIELFVLLNDTPYWRSHHLSWTESHCAYWHSLNPQRHLQLAHLWESNSLYPKTIQSI